MRIVESVDVGDVLHLWDEWLGIARGSEFGVELDPDVLKTNMIQMIDTGGVLLLAIDDDDKTVGFFAVSPIQSAFSRQMIAAETMWYASENKKHVGVKLLAAAIEWAKLNGCDHLMLAASRLASGMHDAVCKFCEKIGAKQFETVYLLEIK